MPCGVLRLFLVLGLRISRLSMNLFLIDGWNGSVLVRVNVEVRVCLKGVCCVKPAPLRPTLEWKKKSVVRDR